MAVAEPQDRPLGEAARERLLVWRRALVEKLDREISGGDIALLGSVQLALDAIAEEMDDDG